MNIYYEIPILKNSAVALGYFDGIHLGHRSVIQSVCGKPNATVLSFADEIPYKHSDGSIITFDEKCRQLESMGIENFIAPKFSSICEYSPERFFNEILMDSLDARLIVCGENYRFGKNALGNAGLLRELCEQRGAECKIMPPIMYGGEPVSSSRIRKALKEGRVADAEKMLGCTFGYKLKVVSGRHLGRTLGAPTLNQYFPKRFVIPKYGVYASVTTVDGRAYHSVTNIGVKPTVGSDAPLSETWIPEYSGDLYGQYIQVNLIEFMREEMRFASVEELKAAILRDGTASKQLTEKHINGGRLI